jgi:hypothetical protein
LTQNAFLVHRCNVRSLRKISLLLCFFLC